MDGRRRRGSRGCCQRRSHGDSRAEGRSRKRRRGGANPRRQREHGHGPGEQEVEQGGDQGTSRVSHSFVDRFGSPNAAVGHRRSHRCGLLPDRRQPPAEAASTLSTPRDMARVVGASDIGRASSVTHDARARIGARAHLHGGGGGAHRPGRRQRRWRRWRRRGRRRRRGHPRSHTGVRARKSTFAIGSERGLCRCVRVLTRRRRCCGAGTTARETASPPQRRPSDGHTEDERREDSRDAPASGHSVERSTRLRGSGGRHGGDGARPRVRRLGHGNNRGRSRRNAHGLHDE